jgi:hypothetical protein
MRKWISSDYPSAVFASLDALRFASRLNWVKQNRSNIRRRALPKFSRDAKRSASSDANCDKPFIFENRFNPR